jgi:hypothetical protein
MGQSRPIQIFFLSYWPTLIHPLLVFQIVSRFDKVYQLLAHGRWFSPGTPASSTTKTGHRDIAEIMLKVALNTKNQSFNPELYSKIAYSL